MKIPWYRFMVLSEIPNKPKQHYPDISKTYHVPIILVVLVQYLVWKLFIDPSILLFGIIYYYVQKYTVCLSSFCLSKFYLCQRGLKKGKNYNNQSLKWTLHYILKKLSSLLRIILAFLIPKIALFSRILVYCFWNWWSGRCLLCL